MRRVRVGDNLRGPNTETTVSLVLFPQVRLGALYFAGAALDLGSMENDWRNEPGEFRRVIGTHGDSSSLILSALMRLKASPAVSKRDF